MPTPNPEAYAAFLNLAGERALIVGGGAVALRKFEGLVRAGARVTLVAPRVGAALARRLKQAGARLVPRGFKPADLSGQRLVFAATNDRGVNALVARLARRRGCWVCVADAPAEGNLQVPALARAGLLRLAISTSGSSPAVAKWLGQKLEKQFKAGSLPATLKKLKDLRPGLKAGRAGDQEKSRDLLRRARAVLREKVHSPGASR